MARAATTFGVTDDGQIGRRPGESAIAHFANKILKEVGLPKAF
jgi:hypothetical protein